LKFFGFICICLPFSLQAPEACSNLLEKAGESGSIKNSGLQQLTQGSMMPLRVNVIGGQRLMERWHMSQAELLLMKFNQGLITVHRERDEGR
jgi:hypothetical protein